MADQITAWSARDASWVDADGDGRIDAPGQAAMAAVWNHLAGAALCRRLGAKLCKALETRQVRFQRPPRGMYGGWHQYMGRTCGRCSCARCAGRYSMRYCGRRNAERCAADLWAGIEKRAQAAAAAQGTTDPARWSSPAVKIGFTPLPHTAMQYTNRPSGIHQIFRFAP